MDVSNELLHRLDELQDQINRIKSYLIENTNIPDDDFWSDEIYIESANDKKTLKACLSRIFEHILKLKYCTNNRNYEVWVRTVVEHRNRIIDILDYENEADQLLWNTLQDNFDSAYLVGIKLYKKAESEYSDLEYNEKHIPIKSPVILDDVMELPLHEVLRKFHDPEVLTTQMQLCPFCKYYQEYGEVRGKLCCKCDNYSECISKYYDA